MEIQGVYNSTSNSYTKTSNNSSNKDTFLNLLMAQIANQDPMSPMDNTQFIAQTAQFTMIEKLQSLENKISKIEMYNLIGKHVTANCFNDITNSNEAVEGLVDSITIYDGDILLNVGEYIIKPENIVGVRNEE